MSSWRKQVLVCLGLVLVCAVGRSPGWAATAAEEPTPYKAGDKLVRGLANVFTGIIEIPRNIHNTSAEESLLAGWTVGLGKGVGSTALRVLVGAYEVVTFPFQIPKGYRPVVEPEYVWQAPGPKIVK